MRFLKPTITLLFLCFLALGGYAQLLTVRGVIYKKSTPERLSLVLVTNINTHVVVMCDELGTFTIKASAGDTLFFNKADYAAQKEIVIEHTDMAVYLQPVIHLSEITVKAQTKQQELNGVMNEYRSKGIYYNGKPSVASSIISPLNGLYSLFGKGPAQARKFAEYSKKELEASQDHRKYNKELVKKITNLPDDEVQKFMDSYTPLHEDLIKWNDYEVISYIKTSLESYKKYGATALQKLY